MPARVAARVNGGGGIRTHETLSHVLRIISPLPYHSATPPITARPPAPGGLLCSSGSVAGRARALGEKLVQFGLRPADSARPDFDGGREFALAHQAVDRRAAEAGFCLDFGRFSRRLVSLIVGSFGLNVPKVAAGSFVANPFCFENRLGRGGRLIDQPS